jgi:hypothetical protein
MSYTKHCRAAVIAESPVLESCACKGLPVHDSCTCRGPVLNSCTCRGPVLNSCTCRVTSTRQLYLLLFISPVPQHLHFLRVLHACFFPLFLVLSLVPVVVSHVIDELLGLGRLLPTRAAPMHATRWQQQQPQCMQVDGSNSSPDACN